MSVVKEVDDSHHSGRQEPRPLMSSWHRIIRFHRILCAKSELNLFRRVARPLNPASPLASYLALSPALIIIVPYQSIQARLDADPGCRSRQMRAPGRRFGASMRRIGGSVASFRSYTLSFMVAEADWDSRYDCWYPSVPPCSQLAPSNGSRDDCCEQSRFIGPLAYLLRRPLYPWIASSARH